jgi:hypothetical protein
MGWGGAGTYRGEVLLEIVLVLLRLLRHGEMRCCRGGSMGMVEQGQNVGAQFVKSVMRRIAGDMGGYCGKGNHARERGGMSWVVEEQGGRAVDAETAVDSPRVEAGRAGGDCELKPTCLPN